MTVSDKDLSSSFDSKISDVGIIQNIYVRKRVSGGAAVSVVVEGDKNTVTLDSESLIRQAFGNAAVTLETNGGTVNTPYLPSTFCIFESQEKDGEKYFVITGGGFGQDIFKAKDGELISINPEMLQEPEKINVTADIALKVYELKSEKVNINGKDMTINTFYNSMIQDLGQSSAAVIRDESNQSKLLENIDSSRSSVSGVSLDEEMISLVQLQHTYSANAKVMSTIDSLLDVVVNGLVR